MPFHLVCGCFDLISFDVSQTRLIVLVHDTVRAMLAIEDESEEVAANGSLRPSTFQWYRKREVLSVKQQICVCVTIVDMS